MRTILMTVLLVTFSLAGCLDSEELGTDSELTGNVQDQAADQANLTAKPEKRFEPVLQLEAEDLFLDKGATVRIDFHISDLGDYPYPTSFIDWNLAYADEPNPVEDGEADDLPGSYERVLYRDGYHNFTFFVDDGQGFKENRTMSIWVGPIPEPEEEVEVGGGGEGGSNAGLPEPLVWEGFAAFAGICASADAERNLYLYYPKSISGVWKYKVTGTTGLAWTTEWWDDATLVGNEGAEGTIPANSDNVAVCPDVAGPSPPASDFKLTLYHPDYDLSAGTGGGGEDPFAGMEDRGWYFFDAATSLCHVKDYDEVIPGALYNSALSGGDWFIAETNDVDGLQIANNHPGAQAPELGSALDLPDCADGDQVVL